VTNKLDFLEKKLQALYPHDDDPLKGLIYFGNDLNDLPVFLRAGFTLCPADAHEKIRFASSFVSSCKSGEHFVRQGVEYLLNLQKLNSEEISGIISNS
jgi:3-deoxy-D-manno-octulosonate 8-phosphate phosphatase KdsC-like HAD superfamily phosphatase